MTTPSPDTDTQQKQGLAHGPGGVVILLCAAALVVIGWATAAVQYSLSDPSHDKGLSTSAPATPKPAVTVTKTVPTLPASCKQALHDFSLYLDSAYTISGANNRQLDLMDEANQAMLLRDWKALQKVVIKQRALAKELGPADATVLPSLIEVQEGMKQCLSDVN